MDPPQKPSSASFGVLLWAGIQLCVIFAITVYMLRGYADRK